jgi:ABC-type dipeptide/oligopeptide/nickel transport system permease subunit
MAELIAAPAAPAPALLITEPVRSRNRSALARLTRHRRAMAGLALLVLLILCAIFADVIAPYDPIKVSPTDPFAQPTAAHLMGTDQLGRDIFSRVIYGARISLTIGIVAVVISLVPGTTLGLIGGYYGSWVQAFILWGTDVLLAFPNILMAMTVIAMLGPSLVNAMIAVGISGMPRYIRLVRGSVLSAREHTYVEAARVVGVPTRRILRVHILPNVIAPSIVLATLDVANAILIAAALSFLGIGAQPPTPEWGAIIASGRNYLTSAWWIATFPGVAIMLAVIGINLFGDGVRDALDPRTQKTGGTAYAA